MGSKKHRQDKAAERRARRQRKSDTNDNFDDFEDDVPKMKIQLERLGLVLKEVEGDGNCLFRALADQLYGSPDRYKRLRQEVPPKLFINNTYTASVGNDLHNCLNKSIKY